MGNGEPSATLGSRTSPAGGASASGSSLRGGTVVSLNSPSGG